MQPRIKYGLIVGGITLLLNICVSTAFGFCGPFIALLAGGAAGFLTVREAEPTTRNDGAREGAVSGGIAGAMILIGQMIASIAALTLQRSSGIQPIIGTLPGIDASGSELALFYSSGIVIGFCFGLIGIGLAALGGAGGGYLGTTNTTKVVEY
jgi:hypothetical protein